MRLNKNKYKSMRMSHGVTLTLTVPRARVKLGQNNDTVEAKKLKTETS